MYKKYLLKCIVLNNYAWYWEYKEFYFDTIEEVIGFIKNGNQWIKPEDIKVEGVFKIEKINIEL